MPNKKVTIKNKLGLHARAASAFVKLSSKFNSEVTLQKDGQVINGKSILGIMTLAAGKGSKLVLRAEGADADQAMSELTGLIDDGFGED
jgi:phosphocarrier protein